MILGPMLGFLMLAVNLLNAIMVLRVSNRADAIAERVRRPNSARTP